MATFRWSGSLVVLALTCAAPALAAGPLDVEVGADWWQNTLHVDRSSLAGGSSSDSAGAAGAHAAVWFQKWGVKAAYDRSNASGGPDADYAHLDVAWKPFQLTNNTFLAVEAGIQRVGYDLGFGKNSSTGPRVGAEGRVAILGAAYAYGEAAWSPRLGDIGTGDPLGSRLEDISYRTYEFGVAVKPFPFVRFRLGYRDERVRATSKSGSSDLGATTVGSRGVVLGVGLAF